MQATEPLPRTNPPERRLSKPSVSVIVPVFNESPSVEDVVRRLLALPIVSEVILVDDGSTDGGIGLDALWDDPRVHVRRHAKNLGKGAAIRTGIKVASCDFVVVQDADLEYSPAEIPRLIAPIVSGEADVVYGSRFAGGSRQSTRVERYLANRLLTWFSNRLTGLDLTDMETGHKAFRRTLIDPDTLREDRFGFEPELTVKLSNQGCRFQELPVSYHPRSYAEGKKIKMRDGLRALWCLLRYRITG